MNKLKTELKVNHTYSYCLLHVTPSLVVDVEDSDLGEISVSMSLIPQIKFRTILPTCRVCIINCFLYIVTVLRQSAILQKTKTNFDLFTFSNKSFQTIAIPYFQCST